MKKTCWNCSHYHATLEEPNVFFHIHDYCDAWNRAEPCLMCSKLNKFLDDEFHDLIDDVIAEYGGDDSYFINDDFEIGQASCYRFEAKEDIGCEAEMRKNFEHNKELALKVVNVILSKMDSEDEYDDDEHQYYIQQKEEIENMRFED